MKTDEDLQVQKVSKSEKDQINEKSPMKSQKDRVKTKSLRSEEDIFRDTEKNLDEDAANVSNVVIGDTLSYTALVCTSQNVFGWGYWFKPSRRNGSEEGGEVGGKEEKLSCTDNIGVAGFRPPKWRDVPQRKYWKKFYFAVPEKKLYQADEEVHLQIEKEEVINN